MNVVFNYNNWWNWADYPNQKVTFDGPNKIIYVSEGTRELDVKVDLYSAWKEWHIGSQEYPHPSNWEKAFTAVGGDPITDTQDLGTTYFLENGWRIQAPSTKDPYTLTVSGNLYTREVGETPFLFAEGVSYSLVRSNIVDLITVESVAVSLTQQDITNIANATADQVWDEGLSDHTIVGSTGKKLSDNLKKTQYIARI